jgi:hypothetical protein
MFGSTNDNDNAKEMNTSGSEREALVVCFCLVEYLDA